MQQFKVVNGQSLLDVCLNTYGSLESLVQLIIDNNIQTINDEVLSGEVFNWNPSPDFLPIMPIYATNNKIFFIQDDYLDGIIDDVENLVIDDSHNNLI